MKYISFQEEMTVNQLVESIYTNIRESNRDAVIAALISQNPFLAANNNRAQAGEVITLPQDENLNIRTDTGVSDPLGGAIDHVRNTLTEWEQKLVESYSSKRESQQDMLSIASTTVLEGSLSESEEGTEIRNQLVSFLDSSIADNEENQTRVAAAVSSVLSDLESLQRRL